MLRICVLLNIQILEYKIQNIKQIMDLKTCMPIKLYVYLDCDRSFNMFYRLQIIITKSHIKNIRLSIHFRLYPSSFRSGFLNVYAKYFKDYYFIATRSINAAFH